MGSAISSFLPSLALFFTPCGPVDLGQLHSCVCGADGCCRTVVEPYCPREGDLVFFDDHSRWWKFLYKIAHTGPPFHVGIVFKKPDGSLALLESGPDDTLWVYVLDVGPRLHNFMAKYHGTLLIRRCKEELCPERSCALTNFAMAQEGKRYAWIRLLLQGTPCKARGRCEATHLCRKKWLCAEVVVAAGTVAGLFPPEVKANSTYPLDIVDDHLYQLGPVWEPAAQWLPSPCPQPPPER